ncbi:folliculin-interacting protein 1-like isoform X1 [Argiope bruennichi]|uniref:Folliculin-interacting protein 2 like protein n=1 Tax=Argiope bruennichi TaxID=94029 RepID=A0A8T0E0D7_ARGBR|nr:folliculin-interacting protein 1-like isoform X1 [Argiope bruennichi]KAF8763826.1 Folliculin-interacting protein 2 like protein [Argiope bruennichi]
MYIGLFDIWKRILQSLGLIPPVNSRYILKDDQQLSQNRVKPPEFDSANQVRVLLFREVNGQDRKLLFDSKAVRKRDPLASPSLGKPPTGANVRRRQESSIEKSFKLNENQSREYVYEWHKSNPDQSLLREMIFGAVSISYHGTTMKIHTIRSPSQIMLSVVFPAPLLPPSSRNGENETEESGTWNSSVEVNIDKSAEKNDHLAHSVPVNVPSRLSGHYIESRDSDSDSLQSHDGHSSLPTTHLSPERPTAGLPRSSSYNSLQRRILRNKATSIEMGLSKSHEMTPNEPVYGTSGNQRQKQERIKLGLSIVINLKEDENSPENKHFTDFFFTHISLIEGHLMELKDTVIRGYINRRIFVHLMFEGSKLFQRCLHDLFTAPRLQNPEWLTIISSPNHRHLSYAFLERFSKLLRQFDKKETNFFVSTLLTAVLTHHLSWVPSVIPTDSKIQSTQSSHKHVPYWVDLLAKSRPYNPLWVQLSDLYGALGVPLRLTKTVIRGQKREVIQNFLRVLSYFIRCSDICQKEFDRAEEFCSENDCLSARSPTLPVSCNALKTDTKVTISTASSCSTTTEKLSPPTIVSEVCLPQNLLLPQTNTASLDADCASHSSKDTCDLTITPTEDRTPEENPSITTHSVLVPNGPYESVKPSALDSLGYMSLEEKMEVINPSKRQALKEQPSNCCLEIGNTNSSVCAMKEGKENDPSTRTVCAKDNQNCVCRSSKSKAGSSSKDYLSADDQQCSILCTKDTTLSCSKVKECESIEEGYHSMEEPHSPSRDNHLSEMLKRLENWCPEGCDGMPLPGLQQLGEDMEPSPYKSLGWSLMADVSDHYSSDFCLQGICGPIREDEIQRDLLRKTQIHILGEPASEALCIVADTDNWTVQLLSSHFMGCEIPGNLGTTIAMSSLVSGICDSIMNMVELGIPPESCIIYLEDRLQELYTRSQTLADYVRSCRFPVPQARIASALNVDVSDLPLLMSIATTHSPNLSVYNR